MLLSSARIDRRWIFRIRLRFITFGKSLFMNGGSATTVTHPTVEPYQLSRRIAHLAGERAKTKNPSTENNLYLLVFVSVGCRCQCRRFSSAQQNRYEPEYTRVFSLSLSFGNNTDADTETSVRSLSPAMYDNWQYNLVFVGTTSYRIHLGECMCVCVARVSPLRRYRYR